MKNFRFARIALLAVVLLTPPVRAKVVTQDEALTVAKNWVTLTIYHQDTWGGYETAEVQNIQEFKRGERILGYFCNVKPQGYIIVSLRTELAPVKAYSASCNLNPQLDEGMADLIKTGMEGILDAIEKLLGPVKSVQTQKLQNILEINYQPAWEELRSDVKTFKVGLGTGVIKINYQEGNILLTSSWHQGDPYNRQCPAPPVGDDCTDAHCLVGCVPLAGAQVMRYWAWPPYKYPSTGTYDWTNMPDTASTSSPQAQINAVAKLCYDVGVESGADYCARSECTTPTSFAGSGGKDLLDAFENNFYYSNQATHYERQYYGAVEWFNAIKAQLNLNRPIPYGVEDHVVVCDGWREIGGSPTRQYHMNYGWNDSHNAWYTLDALYWGGLYEEEMLLYIYPAQALGNWLSGTYSRNPSFPYRYFDQDATGVSATFAPGQNLQFLPGVTVKGTSITSDHIRFEGTTTNNTRLFSIKGTAAGSSVAGVRIYNGAIKLFQNGSLRFH